MTNSNDDVLKNSAEKISKRQIGLHRISSSIILSLEGSFYWYGKMIGGRPFLFIFFCILMASACGIGLMEFKEEIRPFKLWIPQDSDFIQVMEWQKQNFPNDFRVQMAIYESSNVLSKINLLKMFHLHNKVFNITTPKASFKTLCAKLPKVSNIFFKRKKRELSLMPDAHDRLRRQAGLFQCLGFNSFEEECFENSILEIWDYNINKFESLTEEQILDDINSVKKSPTFGIPKNFSNLLSGIERNKDGLIVKARAAQQVWLTKINKDMNFENQVDDPGTGMVVDKASFEWEEKFIDVLLQESQNITDPKIYFMSSASFGKISGSTIIGDVKYLGVGFTVVFIFVQVMLGRFNLVEQRPILSLFGISCIGLSILVSYGLCSAFGVPFGPVNNVLPFLLLGLGVDDMFVFMQSWNNLLPKEKELKLTERVGLALKHAGVSITITSLTDFVAFAIGSTTILPALRSFCLYAAVGILAVYFFQATFFVAWFTLDQRRLEDNRQGLIWCWKLKNYQPNHCSQKDLSQIFFKDYFAKYLLKPCSKVAVLAFTFILSGVSIWGLINLRQEFNPIWFLPQSSYLYKFFIKKEEFFPAKGSDGIIYLGNVSLSQELSKLELLMSKLRESEFIGELDSWYDGYKDYVLDLGFDPLDSSLDEETFNRELQEFLFSSAGAKYKMKNFKFEGVLNCTDPIPPILASSIDFKYKFLPDSKTKIKAMDETKKIIKDVNISGYAQAWSRDYSAWETDKVIQIELYRNLGLAIIVIFIMTLMLIASIRTSFMVLLCVIMTLIDVGAMMHWWGLTIDTVSCIDLVLAIGLCVDYAAHIGHTFMTQAGSNNQRVEMTLLKIGPAVLNGGFSTVLAFVFLAGSDSHVFSSFFKIFFGVCLYGLYHGLVFLPVLLSIIGPPAYANAILPTNTDSIQEPSEELLKGNCNLKETIC